MQSSFSPAPHEVEQLLRNAQLRDELEPYVDESVTSVDWHGRPTAAENEYLECMLAWEKAPITPIREWLGKHYQPLHPDALNDAQLSTALWELIHRLYQHRIVIEHADHLSDRELYWIVFRDILPASVKHLRLPRAFLRWRCVDAALQPELWLSYYADPTQRQRWSREHGRTPPPHRTPPYPRLLPQAG